MKMSKQDAFAKFGSYLSVRVGDYDVIDEHLGDYEARRKNNSVNDDTPYDWYFPNTEEGLAAAKTYAYVNRLERRYSSKWLGIQYRRAVINSKWSELRILWAWLMRDKAFLKKVEDYKSETAKMIALNNIDHVDNISIIGFPEDLELGTVLEIGDPIYFVTNDYGEVKMTVYFVTCYGIYDAYKDSTVDVLIHSLYGHKRGMAEGFIENQYDPSNSTGFVNKAVFFDGIAASRQAAKWAQEIVDKNSKWL